MVKLIELLGNKNLIKILDYFLTNPTIEVHQKELQNKLKLAKATLNKWLRILVKNEFLKLRKFGRVNIYHLNRENTIVKELKRLKNILMLSGLKKIVKDYKIKIYLYGSAARGEDIEDSDLDLLIIGKIKREDIFGEIEKISRKLRRRISIQIFTPFQWSEMSRKDKAFYERVEKDKIEL